jgi:hypothetical protein
VAELEDAREAATAVEANIHDLTANMERHDAEIAYRREERDRVQMLVAAAENAIAQRRGDLGAAQREQFDAQRDLIAARTELESLQRGRDAIENAAPATAVIEHLPTPMAKTVFGKEIHFRLAGGRLMYVPWDELVEDLKKEAPQKVWRLKNEAQFTETLGPVHGFWMKYTLRRADVALPTRGGMRIQQRVELDRFVLLPVSENQGELFDDAMQPGSEFYLRLQDHPPAAATVTVWVYPDSYGLFRTLKRTLFELGYLSASRPLPEGHPIGGSPLGTRSAAE